MKTKVALSVGAALLSLNVSASPLSNSNEAKALGMGGVGVAVTDITNAMTHNPAILSSRKIKDGWFLSLPSLSVGVSDEDDFVDAIDNFQDNNSIDALQDAIDASGMPGSYNHIADVADNLSGELSNISDRRIEGDIGGLISLAIPGQKFGFGIKASFGTSIGGEIQYRDAGNLNDLSSDLRAFENCYEDNMNALGSCLPQDLDLNFVDPNTGDVDFDVDEDLQSQVLAQGLVIGEVGFAFTHMHMFGKTPVSFSVMPKMQHISVLHYGVGVDVADVDDITDDEFINDKTAFNADIGMLVELSDHVNVGFTVANLVAQEVETAVPVSEGGELIEIEPQAKLGAAYEYAWFTVAVDADLTKNKRPFGVEEQIVAVGAEMDAWDFAKIRVGYRHDLEDAERDLISAGVGLNLLGLTVDLGAAANEDKAIASLQLGYKW